MQMRIFVDISASICTPSVVGLGRSAHNATLLMSVLIGMMTQVRNCLIFVLGWSRNSGF